MIYFKVRYWRDWKWSWNRFTERVHCDFAFWCFTLCWGKDGQAMRRSQ